MTATALVYYGLLLLLVCGLAALSEKYLFPNDKQNDVKPYDQEEER